MAQERDYYYEKYKEDGTIDTCPIDDKDGAITGRIILNVIAYFDENPEERKRLGWTKHIEHKPKDQVPDYNPQTQFLVRSLRQVDEWTVEDVYHALDKSEDQLAFEEMLNVSMGEVSYNSGFMFYGGN